MKKTIKYLISLLIVLTLFLLMSQIVSAEVTSSFSGVTNFEGKPAFQRILSTILAIVRTVGVTVAIIILIVIGCKYMVASAGDRADIKKSSVNYFVGALILFGASGILSVVKSAVDKTLGS